MTSASILRKFKKESKLNQSKQKKGSKKAEVSELENKRKTQKKIKASFFKKIHKIDKSGQGEKKRHKLPILGMK